PCIRAHAAAGAVVHQGRRTLALPLRRAPHRHPARLDYEPQARQRRDAGAGAWGGVVPALRQQVRGRTRREGGRLVARTKPRTQARFYGSREWKALRRRVRLEEPTCTICHAAATTDVHHRDGDWRNTARSNLTG